MSIGNLEMIQMYPRGLEECRQIGKETGAFVTGASMTILGNYGLRAQPPSTYVSSQLNFQLMAIEVEDLPIEPTVDAVYDEQRMTSDKFIELLPVEDTQEFVKRQSVAYLFGAEEHTGATVCVKVKNFRPVLFYHTNLSPGRSRWKT